MSLPTNETILKKGIIVNSIGIVSKFSRAFYLILFSTTLGTTQFGLYTYSYAIIEVLSNILQFAHGKSLAVQFGKYRHRGEQKYIFKVGNHVFLIDTIISTIFAVGFYFLIPHIFEHMGHQSDYVGPLQILCFSIPLYTLKYNILYSIRASFDMRHEVFVLSMIEPLLILLGGWIAFQFKVDVLLLCWSLVAVFAATLIMSYVLYFHKYHQETNEMDPNFHYLKFMKSSLPMALMEAINTIMAKSDLLFIGYFVSPALVGIYSAAFEISAMITKMRAAVEPTLGSLVQKIHHENDKGKIREWFTRSMFWSLLPTTAIAGFIIVDPNFFMSFFKFGPSYKPYFMILPILAFGRMLHSVFGLIDAPLYMVDHSKSSMRISLFNFILSLFFFSIMIPRIGLWGAAIGYSASAIFTTIYRLYLSNKIFNIVPVNQAFLIPVAALSFGVVLAKSLQIYVTSKSYVLTSLVFIVFACTYFVIFQGLRNTQWYKRTTLSY